MNEDILYCSKCGLEYSQSAIKEFIVSRNIRINQLYDYREFKNTDEYKKVYHSLKQKIEKVEPLLVIDPLSVGGHIDHRIATEALRMICSENLVYYEDLPYAADYLASEIQRLTKAYSSSLCRKVHRVNRDDKFEKLHCYRSQIGRKEYEKLLQYNLLNEHELTRDKDLSSSSNNGLVECVWIERENLAIWNRLMGQS